VATQSDVDDVLQEVFVRVHRGEAAVRDGERFGGWVHRIARHAVADHLRSRARHPVRSEGDVETAVPDDESTLEAELGECVALFVARLPSPYREAITLTDLEGLTQKDAAEMLGLSVSGMKSRVQRGRDRIRQMFEQCCEISVDARGRVIECTVRSLENVPEDCRAAAESWAARHPR
jgi:RNA polymerase sigma-70 factor (ECF subfamily)